MTGRCCILSSVVAGGAPVLILICGLPGAGKTTLARRLEQELPAIRLSPDEWIADLGVDFYNEAFRDRLERRLRRS
jgi:predicted kinase